MMYRLRFGLVAALLLLGTFAHVTAQPTRVTAAVYVAPPFVMTAGTGYTGFTWDLWQLIARDLKLQVQIHKVDSVSELLQQVRDGEVDIAVANLSINAARYSEMDFSLPYFDGGLRIMIDEDRHTGISGLITGLRRSGHLHVYAWLAGLIVIGTIVLTLIDRRWHPGFPRDWIGGLAVSFYHVVSVFTSGKTAHPNLWGVAGTVLAAIWLACGVAVIAYVTSSVTSVMTASALMGEIHSVRDLGGNRHVGVLAGTVGETFCRQAMLDVASFDTLDAAVDALVKGRINAIVLDAPMLEWYDNAHPELPITVVGPVFQADRYGFALPSGSPLTREVSQEILRLDENGILDALRNRYFGTTR